ncbi:hypothetical protein BH09ACT5_BH09ACT5_09170 [soil metagenome]
MAGRVVVGMAGWVYPDWRGTFYPPGLVQKNELGFASTHVTSIELNGSFYSLQKPTSWRSWARQTPDDFVFSVRAPRFITNVRKLEGVQEHMADFFAATQKGHPGGELGQAQDVADAVTFLASDRAKHINGVNLTVDGGFLKRVDF